MSWQNNSGTTQVAKHDRKETYAGSVDDSITRQRWRLGLPIKKITGNEVSYLTLGNSLVKYEKQTLFVWYTSDKIM